MTTAAGMLTEKNREPICLGPEDTVMDAIKIMNENRIGAILIKENGTIKGIFTERDLLCNMVNPGFNPDRAQLKDYMTEKLHTVPHNANLYTLLDTFLGLRHRHLLIEENGTIIGMLSQGDVIRTSLNQKTKELDELNAKYNWEYYEDWKFKIQR